MSETTPPDGYQTTINLYSPTIRHSGFGAIGSSVNVDSGPNLGATFTPAYPYGTPVVNGYLIGSLNKDEADEMNLYTTNNHDMPYGPSDLEWLYRKHDVDGSSLNSRLSQLAPVSFLNPADGLTRRRMFSTDVWDLNTFSWANDNPVPYAGILGFNSAFANNHSADHDFTYNSRFMPNASPSLDRLNQVVSVDPSNSLFNQFANPVTTEFLPNPTLPAHTSINNPNNTSFSTYFPNSSTTSYSLPLNIEPSNPNNGSSEPNSLYNLFFKDATNNHFTNSAVNLYTNVIDNYSNPSLTASRAQTPTVAHRDRKINLNYPLPISNDPAEPIREKWCRETYQMLKAILPPASLDTPEELAALSQFVVNIIDFRDHDCTMTRFVNTDLVVVDTLTKTKQPTAGFDPAFNVSPMGVRFAGSGDTFPVASPETLPLRPQLVQPRHGNPISGPARDGIQPDRH